MSKPRAPRSSSIEIIGADANNLKTVDVTFPLNRISVVTGVSGSGKSSLLSDTLAAEGSRRMRTYLGMSQQELERDDVKAFIGALPPTILVGQRGFRPSVRTTVGTASGFLSVLRRLFVLASTPYSERAKENVPAPSADSYARWISKHYRGPAEIWAAPVRQQRTDGVAAVKRLASHGIEQIVVRSETDPPRLREGGRALRASEFRALNPNITHTIEALVGTIAIDKSAQATQLRELLEQAFAAGNKSAVVMLPASEDPDLAGPFGRRLDSTKHWLHPDTLEIFAPPSAHLLSFNAPEHEESGACRNCGGTGIGRRIRDVALVAHPERSMAKGAFAIWTQKNYKYVNVQHETIEGLRDVHGFSPDVPWSKLPASARSLVLNGSGGEPVFDREPSGRKVGAARPFAGFRKIILEKSSTGSKVAEQLAAYVETGPCDVCQGTRWSFQARALRIGGHGIAEVLGMIFSEVEVFASDSGDLARAVGPEPRSIVEALRRHAHSLVSVGLGYLTGDRGMLEVSEGESRRIRLARVLDAPERGLCLLFDEPARGLHEADLSPLALALERLRGQHTIILNEHRERLWHAADWFVEVGPGAGASGGEITYAGPPRRRMHDAEPMRAPLPFTAKRPKITIRGASIHNVENVNCEIPLGRLTCISGVSGSGKSSFVRGVLAPALLASAAGDASDFNLRSGRWHSVGGAGLIKEVVALDQRMPPPNRRSLVATVTGVFDDVRKVFGTSAGARRDGLSPTDFGVNGGIGRCPICQGVGEIKDTDVWSVCPACGGSRYGHAALSVRIDGTNVQELLETPVERLSHCGETFRIPQRLIASMCDLGIGYVALGRRIDTLSGGEVQRLRLAMRLGSVSTGSTIFILDEPAVGLHPSDVQRLALALKRVLDEGRNTVVIVEHDLRLIRSADWVLEFGPGSGPDGGHIVFSGTPNRLAGTKTPTGLALAGKLPRSGRSPQPRKPARPGLPLEEQAMRTSSLLRTLIGDGSATLDSDSGPIEPVVAVSKRFWSNRDSWEVAGMDREIPKLLLDEQCARSGDVFEGPLAAWGASRECWLAIHPFITDMQVWGAELPASVRRATSSHLANERLRLVTTKGDRPPAESDVRQLRATGGRFVPEDDTDEARLRVLRDAFAVGARYVELRDRSGKLCATASDRLLDLGSATIAPIVPLPTHFSRHHPLGQCPMCKGTRVVTTVSEDLVVRNRKTTPDSEGFLTTQATGVIKGVRRNELNPFLSRLAKEGLWNPKASFDRLELAGRNLILFGFWSRPGSGSFLKSSSANPAEVASWLRWDGLYRHVLDQADRSEDVEWTRHVQKSAHQVRCVRCDGSGLQPFARLLHVGRMPFDKWTRLSDLDGMLDLLRCLEPRTARQRRSLERVLYCLSPLADAGASLAAVVKRSVESFTTMPAIELADPDKG